MIKFPSTWKDFVLQEQAKPYYAALSEFVKNEYATRTVYPPAEKVFSALRYCSPEDVKVVIIGQDPYHGPGQANGLAFSVSPEITQFPPSLKNIFIEVCDDTHCPYPKDGNLERWARQGVLLLNATLTVRRGEPLSHANKGWETFTDDLISYLSRTRTGIVYILWGSNAKSKERLIDRSNNLILTAVHPSPLSANKGGFFGCHHFSKANDYLREKHGTEIKW